MPCYRLTFKNTRVFEVVINATDVAESLNTRVCTALMYRVTNDVREHRPLRRLEGDHLQIVATNHAMALEIAQHVLTEVTGSAVEMVSECGTRSMLPALPNLAR